MKFSGNIFLFLLYKNLFQQTKLFGGMPDEREIREEEKKSLRQDEKKKFGYLTKYSG